MNIVIRKGNHSDLQGFLFLTRQVRQNMANPEWFAIDPEEELREMMENGTMDLWMAEDSARLAAVFSAVRPGLQPFNLGYELELSLEELLRVIHMDTAAVDQDYRGRKLQKRMMEHAEHSYPVGTILLCTIHPDNRFSLENALSLGYRVEKKIAKYGSIRYILRKDI